MKHLLQLFLLIVLQLQLNAQVTYNVQVSNTVFTPPAIVINQGDAIQWTNIAGFHNVNGTLGTYPLNPQGFTSGAPAPNPWVYSNTFVLLGTYNYTCDVHFGMTGTVTVNGPLPVELQFITASVYKGICKVEWKTDKEENLQDFTLQKSTNAVDYSDVITLNANHIPSTYSYADELKTEKYVYYRVKITDVNNAVKYTPVRLAQNDIKITKNTIQLLPNPYTDHFHIDVLAVQDWTGLLGIYDMTGRALYKNSYNFTEGNNYIHLDKSANFPKGIYLVAIRNNNNKEVLSATVVKE